MTTITPGSAPMSALQARIHTKTGTARSRQAPVATRQAMLGGGDSVTLNPQQKATLQSECIVAARAAIAPSRWQRSLSIFNAISMAGMAAGMIWMALEMHHTSPKAAPAAKGSAAS